jgi:hypothetical protein
LTGAVQKVIDAQYNSIECYKKAHYKIDEIFLWLLMVSRKCQDIQTSENINNPLQERSPRARIKPAEVGAILAHY